MSLFKADVRLKAEANKKASGIVNAEHSSDIASYLIQRVKFGLIKDSDENMGKIGEMFGDLGANNSFSLLG